MGAAITLRDIVGEAQRHFARAVVPPHCQFNADPFLLLAQQADRRTEEGLLALVEPFNEGDESALELKENLMCRDMAIILQRDGQARVEEGKLPKPPLQHREFVFGPGEGAAAWLEGNLGSAPLLRRADNLQRLHRLAVLEADDVFLAAAPDAHQHPFGQGVHHRGADAMEAARDLVGILVELAAGMQAGQHHLGGRNTFFFMHINGDAAAVITHGDRSVAVQRHLDARSEAGLRLIDSVVDDLEGHMVQARAVIGIPDVHARPLADGLQALEDRDGGAVIVLPRGG